MEVQEKKSFSKYVHCNWRTLFDSVYFKEVKCLCLNTMPSSRITWRYLEYSSWVSQQKLSHYPFPHLNCESYFMNNFDTIFYLDLFMNVEKSRSAPQSTVLFHLAILCLPHRSYSVTWHNAITANDELKRYRRKQLYNLTYSWRAWKSRETPVRMNRYAMTCGRTDGILSHVCLNLRREFFQLVHKAKATI
jgi:hypothetical protein